MHFVLSAPVRTLVDSVEPLHKDEDEFKSTYSGNVPLPLLYRLEFSRLLLAVSVQPLAHGIKALRAPSIV